MTTGVLFRKINQRPATSGSLLESGPAGGKRARIGFDTRGGSLLLRSVASAIPWARCPHVKGLDATGKRVSVYDSKITIGPEGEINSITRLTFKVRDGAHTVASSALFASFITCFRNLVSSLIPKRSWDSFNYLGNSDFIFFGSTLIFHHLHIKVSSLVHIHRSSISDRHIA